MGNQGILVYCIADKLDRGIAEIVGIDGKRKLYAEESEGLFAISSDIDLGEYGEEAMAEKGEDINWLREKATVFMNIILQTSSFTDIIPMKFLTIFKTADRVKRIISDNMQVFTENLKKIKNKKELSVKIYCDDQIYKTSIMAQEMADFEKTLVGKPKGATFFLKKKYESELRDKIHEKIYAAANLMTERLDGISSDFKQNKILAKEITGIETPMIQNCAFLVDTDKKEQFESSVRELSEEYEKNGFTIDMSGPWPPYSFCE